MLLVLWLEEKSPEKVNVLSAASFLDLSEACTVYFFSSGSGRTCHSQHA